MNAHKLLTWLSKPQPAFGLSNGGLVIYAGVSCVLGATHVSWNACIVAIVVMIFAQPIFGLIAFHILERMHPQRPIKELKTQTHFAAESAAGVGALACALLVG